MATKTKPWERRMVCEECRRTIDVLRAPRDSWTEVWDGRASRDIRHKERRPFPRRTGIVPRHMIRWWTIPEGLLQVLAEPGAVLAYCHPEKCGRLIILNVYEIARMCREAESGSFEV